jgi:hypothetical protein
MFNSQAFAALNRSGMIVVLSMLDKLHYASKPRKDRKNVKISNPLKNDGRFVLIGAELKARGLKSEKAIAEGRRQAWELGFYDVIKTGTCVGAGKYRYSERWKRYPTGDYLPHDQEPPGANMWHKFAKKKETDLPAQSAGKGHVHKVQVQGKSALPVKSAGKEDRIPATLPAQSAGIL